jgi:hypothetical protein
MRFKVGDYVAIISDSSPQRIISIDTSDMYWVQECYSGAGVRCIHDHGLVPISTPTYHVGDAVCVIGYMFHFSVRAILSFSGPDPYLYALNGVDGQVFSAQRLYYPCK